MSKRWIKIISIFILSLAIYGLWVGLEIAYYGEVQHRAVDDIIGLILLWSLCSNFNHWIDKIIK